MRAELIDDFGGPSMSIQKRGRDGRSASDKGQTFVELALVLPVLLLVVLVALDFGRAYYSWVTVTNATRVGANYAALNPNETFPNATYSGLVQNEALNSLCPVAANSFNPTFIDGPDAGTTTKDLGDSAKVSVTCSFKMLTPVISAIVGNSVAISSSSTFPVRRGVQ